MFDLKNDSADDIAAAIVGNISDNKATVLAKAITERLKRKSRKPAG